MSEEPSVLQLLRLRRDYIRDEKKRVDKESPVWYELDSSERALDKDIKSILDLRKEAKEYAKR